MNKSALDYAVLACETMMKKFAPQDLPLVGRFHYHEGVFLSGMQNVYHLTGDEKYFDYIKGWVDSIVRENGDIVTYFPGELDDMQPGILLFELYEKTGDNRYKTALDTLASHLEKWPANSEGGFWHKDTQKDHMWLDGMYMGGPIMTEYGLKFDRKDFWDTVHLQMSLMKKHCRDEQTGLYYHIWDASKECEWVDKETGCSNFFWGRAIGWYAVAMFEIASLLPESYEKRNDFINTGVELLEKLIKYQDKQTGLWYQVVDKGHMPDNWHEVSCSCLFIYALCKAINMGEMSQDFKEYAKKGYEGVVSTLKYYEDGGLCVNRVCVGTGVGDYEHYINRPTSENDLHGMGAFLLMCCEYYRLNKKGE